MTVYEYYEYLSDKADDADYVGDFDEGTRLGDEAVAFRDEHFTKEDWERLISETDMAVGKVALKKLMLAKFPETVN